MGRHLVETGQPWILNLASTNTAKPPARHALGHGGHLPIFGGQAANSGACPPSPMARGAMAATSSSTTSNRRKTRGISRIGAHHNPEKSNWIAGFTDLRSHENHAASHLDHGRLLDMRPGPVGPTTSAHAQRNKKKDQTQTMDSPAAPACCSPPTSATKDSNKWTATPSRPDLKPR